MNSVTKRVRETARLHAKALYEGWPGLVLLAIVLLLAFLVKAD